MRRPDRETVMDWLWIATMVALMLACLSIAVRWWIA